jgi:succinyl-diaminopimelate desuccinylase
MIDSLLSAIANRRDFIVSLHEKLAAIPALGPTSGGAGEKDKAAFLVSHLKSMGFATIHEMCAPDPRVPCGYRPNLAVRLPGRSERTLWIIGHTDIVPPGDLALWKSDPYKLVVDGDVLIARGVEDNHQAIVSGLALAQALLDEKITPDLGLGLVLVADEETGSDYGLEYVLQKHADLFREGDLFLIPDFGLPNSEMVEVAEKSLIWLKVIVNGRQCHGSTPSEGRNTLVAAADFIMRLRGLYADFPQELDMFNPPISTFEPTKKEANVENVNTIPGRDVFYLDCRVLPGVSLDEVLDRIKAYGAQVATAHGVGIEYEVEQRQDSAPPTSPESEVVVRLLSAIRAVYGTDPKPQGIGGGTVAAMLRRRGHPAVVWATWQGTAHQPNERSLISANVGDAQVMARMLFDPA